MTVLLMAMLLPPLLLHLHLQQQVEEIVRQKRRVFAVTVKGEVAQEEAEDVLLH